MNEKLQELILYISQKCREDKRFGDTKLCKILFHSDFGAYGLWGKPITGSRYIRNHNGPTPKEIMVAKRALQNSGKFHMEERPYYAYTQKVPTANVNPNLSLFEKEEIELVDRIIAEHWEDTATDMSDETHTYFPWLKAEQGEEIPYEAIFVLKEIPVSTADMNWAQNILAEID